MQTVTALFEQWQTNNKPSLTNLEVGSHPKQLIETLSEDILRIFAEARLIDKYAVYQHLMSYWGDTMQDDVYLISQDGWRASSDLIPAQLIMNRYFVAELATNRDSERPPLKLSSHKLEEMDEEYAGEDGLLEEAKNEKGKITKASIKIRQKDLFGEPDTEEEQSLLNTYLDLLEQEAEARKKVRDAQKALDAKVAAKYKQLNEEEVKILVVDDKWLATLAADVQGELNCVSQI